jgi:hypothetical protein
MRQVLFRWVKNSRIRGFIRFLGVFLASTLLFLLPEASTSLEACGLDGYFRILLLMFSHWAFTYFLWVVVGLESWEEEGTPEEKAPAAPEVTVPEVTVPEVTVLEMLTWWEQLWIILQHPLLWAAVSFSFAVLMKYLAWKERNGRL